jgi:HEAT repeat protein
MNSRMKLIAAGLALGFLSLSGLTAGEDEAKAAYLEGWYQETAEGKPEKAIEAYKKVIEASGDVRTSGMALLRIGICLKALNKEAEARAAFEEVISKYSAEGDLAARAKRSLSGKGDEAAAGLSVTDPRVEILSFLEDMEKSKEKPTPEDLTRFLTILRLATPEYVKEVVLVKYPKFGDQAFSAIKSWNRDAIPESDPVRLLTFTGIPTVREPIFAYLSLRQDRSVIPHILPFLDSTDRELRNAAVRCLGELGAQEVAPRILELLRKETAEGGAASTLVEALGKLRAAEAVGEIVKKKADHQIESSVAAGALSRIASQAALDALKPLLLTKEGNWTIFSVWKSLHPRAEGDLEAQIVSVGLGSDDLRHSLAALEFAFRYSNLNRLVELYPRMVEALRRLAASSSSPQFESFAKLVGPNLKVYTPKALASWVIVQDFRSGSDWNSAVAPLYRDLIATDLRESALDFFSRNWVDVEMAIDDPALRLEVRIRRIRETCKKQSLNNSEPAAVLAEALEDPSPAVVLTALDVISPTQPKYVPDRVLEVLPRLVTPLGREVKPGAPTSPNSGSGAENPPEVRMAALETLVKMKDLESCLPALDDPVARIRLRAAEFLYSMEAAHLQAAKSGDLLVQRKLIQSLMENKQLQTYWNCLPAYFDSRFPEIRALAAETLMHQKEVPRSVGLPLAQKAVADPAPGVSKEWAFDLLISYEAWTPIIERWDDFVKVNPKRAIEVTRKLKRQDLLRALISPKAAVVSSEDQGTEMEAARVLIELSGTEGPTAYLSDPLPMVRLAAVKQLVKEQDLKSLARALTDQDPAVAQAAFAALSGFSEELKGSLDDLGALPEGFKALEIGKRREISEAIGKRIEEKGKAIWIGKAKELLREASGPKRRGDTLESRRALALRVSAVQLLVAALPEPEALEILVTNQDLDVAQTASALGKLRLREPLLRIAERFEKNQGALPQEVLENLVLAGETAYVFRWMRDHLNPKFDYGPVVLASAEAGPEGPLPFLDFLKAIPDRPSDCLALVMALKKVHSTSGLLRAVNELPQPPVIPAFKALIEIGSPEPVLEQALQGPFWFEAARALHDATGQWFDYYGPLSGGSNLAKVGSLSVSFDGTVNLPLDPQHRQSAVAAWRKALSEADRRPAEGPRR